MRIIIYLAVLFPALLSASTASAQQTPTPHKTEYVILVIADGLRWQEVFRGADVDMMTSENLVKNPEAFRPEFDAGTTEARRRKLMPFLWDHVAAKGQLYGNRDKGSIARTSNMQWFSYPGYNELLSGFADDTSITSNRKLPNPNVTVFEWLARQPGVDAKVAAFGAWDVFPYIFNTGRCGFPVDGGDRPFTPSTGVTPGMDMINRIRSTTPYRWEAAAFDSLVYPMFTEYLQHQKPKVAFLALGETDEWGHEGNYEKYLRAANQTDKWLKELWDLVQSMPEYRDKTTVIFTCDHGRGDDGQDLKAWNSHGRKYAGSDAIFVAVWGPDTAAEGEIAGGPEILQAQVAATLAAALGYSYNAAQPKAALPIPGVVGPVDPTAALAPAGR